MMDKLIVWMASTRLAHFMGDWQWAWPWSETLHYIGLSLLLGSLLIMDLRLMGFMRKYISLQAAHALTPVAIVGFSLNLITGIAFFVKDAERYVPNQSFVFKMIMMVIACANVLVLWLKIDKHLKTAPPDADPPISAKVVGATSLIAWTLVLWGGRLIPVYGPG